MDAGFIEENGARFVVNTLTPGQGTLFPKGSIHYQLNLGCEPLTFVAALNDEDPGVSQIAQRCEYFKILLFLKVTGADVGPFSLVFGLPPDVVAATLGDVGVQEVVSLATGVSPTHSMLPSLSHGIPFRFPRSRTTWPSASTGVSRSVTSRGANKPRPSSNPGSMETLSRNKDKILSR